MIRATLLLMGFALALASGPPARAAQSPRPDPTAEPAGGAIEVRRADPPFRVGETLDYSIAYAFLEAGTLRLAVAGIESMSGRQAYHLTFNAQTNSAVSAIYSLKDRVESWLDVERLHSLRFAKLAVEKGKRREKDYRLDQARHIRVNQKTGEEEPMPPDAQDDLSVFYYLRTLPLTDGTRYTLPVLMDPDDNPMRLTVLGTEKVKVPAGTFDCWVVALDVKTDSGIFAQRGDLRMWMTRDARRIPVKLESKLKIGSFTATLTGLEPGPGVASAAARPAAGP